MDKILIAGPASQILGVNIAKELGIIGIHYTNVKKLIKEFEKLKIMLN